MKTEIKCPECGAVLEVEDKPERKGFTMKRKIIAVLAFVLLCGAAWRVAEWARVKRITSVVPALVTQILSNDLGVTNMVCVGVTLGEEVAPKLWRSTAILNSGIAIKIAVHDTGDNIRVTMRPSQDGW